MEQSKAKSSFLMKEQTEEQSILLLNMLDGTLLAVTWLHLLPHRCNFKIYLLGSAFFRQVMGTSGFCAHELELEQMN